jgi:hypothetical protein
MNNFREAKTFFVVVHEPNGPACSPFVDACSSISFCAYEREVDPLQRETPQHKCHTLLLGLEPCGVNQGLLHPVMWRAPRGRTLGL